MAIGFSPAIWLLRHLEKCRKVASIVMEGCIPKASKSQKKKKIFLILYVGPFFYMYTPSSENNVLYLHMLTNFVELWKEDSNGEYEHFFLRNRGSEKGRLEKEAEE